MTKIHWPEITWTRRQVLKGGLASASVLAVGCSGTEAELAPDAATAQDSTVAPDLSAPDVPAPEDVTTPEVGEPPPPAPAPDLRAEMWHTAALWARADPTTGVSTRLHLYNPASVPMTLDVHLFTPAGVVAWQKHDWRTLAPDASIHPEVAELCAEGGVPMPFEGTVWMGSKPESGPTYLGLQGFGVDWSGPTRDSACVHGMRDFGNSNHDLVWSDMVHPRAVVGPRFETYIAIANGSGVGGDLQRVATPVVTVSADDGTTLGTLTLDPLPAYATRLLAISEIVGTAPLDAGTVRVVEPEVGLVAIAFLKDKESGAFVSADHLFDRHFVDCVPFANLNGCVTSLEPF